MNTTSANFPSSLEPGALPNIAQLRLLIGLVQGLLLYFLYYSTKDWSTGTATWPASNPYIFVPLLLIFTIAPVLLTSGLGHLQRRSLIIWILTIIFVLALLGAYDVWRGVTIEVHSAKADSVRFPSYTLCLFVLAGLCIAHSMVLAGASEKKWIARYSTYYEVSWRFFGQLVFSFAFAAILSSILELGGWLFSLIKLYFLKDLLEEEWFAIPLTCVAFSLAMHSTYALTAISRVLRSLLLSSPLSWILLMFTCIVVVFLLCLPWTGLAPLWATRMATSVLLGSVIILVILINVIAVRDGTTNDETPQWARICSYIAALTLLPLAVIAIHALYLRVSDHGWTTDRIVAAAALAIATCYAIGYAYAVRRRNQPILRFTQVNIAMAFVIIGALLALLSPILDPARISVNNQLARLADGRTKADKFDYDYLKFEGGRFGLAALNELKVRSQGPDAATISKKAKVALEKTYRWESPKATPAEVVANIRVQHNGRPIPQSLVQKNWNDENDYGNQPPACLTDPDKTCDAYWIDMDAEKGEELILVPGDTYAEPSVWKETKDGWVKIATIMDGCKLLSRQKMQAGQFRAIPASPLEDLEVDGVRYKTRISERNPTACKSNSDKK